MKKYILFILIFSFASFFSQISSVKYYIEFKSQKFKPSVYNQRDNNLILVNKKVIEILLENIQILFIIIGLINSKTQAS